FFSSRRRHTRFSRDWSSDVCSSDLELFVLFQGRLEVADDHALRGQLLLGPGPGALAVDLEKEAGLIAPLGRDGLERLGKLVVAHGPAVLIDGDRIEV